MSDVTVTAANVKPVGATGNLTRVVYGATVTQGQPVYSDASDSNEYKPADADASASAVATGIAITPGGDGEYGLIATTGQINIGGTLTQGQVYVVSTNAGGVAPYSDLGSGDYVTILGVASSSSVLDLDINATGIAKP